MGDVPVAHATGDSVKFVGGRLPTQINSKDYARYSSDESYLSTCFDPIQVRRPKRKSRPQNQSNQDMSDEDDLTQLAKEQHGSSFETGSFKPLQTVLDSERSGLGRSERLDGPRTGRESRKLYPMRKKSRTDSPVSSMDDPVVQANIQALRQMRRDEYQSKAIPRSFQDQEIPMASSKRNQPTALSYDSSTKSLNHANTSKEASKPCLIRRESNRAYFSPWWIILVLGLIIFLPIYFVRRN